MRKCPSPTGFFKIDNLLGELWTEAQKSIARKNLGIDNLGGGKADSLEWGSITGDIYNQKDLLEFAKVLGIPILTQPMYDLLENKPDKYIVIPDDSEFSGNIENKVYTTTTNGNYLDILFSAIRSLLSEVAKLKNSFYYGIQSYNDEFTTSSDIVNSKEEEATEPLWALDPEDLTDSDLDFVITPETDKVDNHYEINLESTVSLITDGDFDEAKEVLYLVIDPKDNPKLIINLNELISFDFDKILTRWLKCNVLFLLSRKVLNIDDEYIGKNYIWCSITDSNNDVITQGYFNIINNAIQQQNGKYLIYNTEQLLDYRYYFKSYTLNHIHLYKHNLYLKNQTFTGENDIPSTIPDDRDFVYKAAHITIRSVASVDVLERIQNRLLNNELIWVESIKQLYIKSNYNLIPLNGGGNIENMADVISTLKELGILTQDGKIDSLLLNNISKLTFIHETSGKTYDIKIDSKGNIQSNERVYITEDEGNNVSNLTLRGAVAYHQLKNDYDLKQANSGIDDTNGFYTKGDKVRISSWYIPSKNQTNYNCTHSFVELTNCSSENYPLNNACISFVKIIDSEYAECATFLLEGILKAGSTYLIRGSLLIDNNSPIAHIKIEDYDFELWQNRTLFDISEIDAVVLHHNKLVLNVTNNKTILFGSNTDSNTKDYFQFVVNPYLIDVVGLTTEAVNYFKDESKAPFWITKSYTNEPNAIIKDQYLLDPAKLAFRSLTSTSETSNTRLEKVAAEIIPLDEDSISFPHSDEKVPVTRYAPKASKHNKNISTDKTSLDFNKPNFVTCAFGINGLTTRCFNWVSVGQYDEFIWIRKQGEESWKRFESYKINDSGPTEDVYPKKKYFSALVNNAVYARMDGIFPGNNVPYRAHKVIIDVVGTPVENETYEYIVGRSTKSGLPNEEHCSEIYTFTMHDSTWTPIVFQTTDLQGFGWMEYQVWAASAKEVLHKIKEECSKNKYYPVFINTGDMTQNGTRVNEWLDYYNGGKAIFKQYELMCVVGNNDLCDSRGPLYLGTGDDFGKSNPYYFHLFFCYEIEDVPTDFVSKDNWQHPLIYNNKYIPSTYYFTLNDKGYLMVNSEITVTACSQLWQASGINLYTGYNTNDQTYLNYCLKETITNMLNNISTNRTLLVACHEMPFTVINDAYLRDSSDADKAVLPLDRSLQEKNNIRSLIGSHLNRIGSEPHWDNDNNYWFSKLLLDKGIKLCIGGHKHTYACTYPIKEYYANENYSYPSHINMSNTKKIVIKRGLGISTVRGGSDYFTFVTDSNLNNGVTYFMLQATGYKVKSNKELPSRNLMFSKIVPETNWTGTATADVSQEYPMYAVIQYNNLGFDIDLYRVANIKLEKLESNKTKLSEFSQIKYNTNPMVSEKLLIVPDGDFYKNYWLTNNLVKQYNENIQRCYLEGEVYKSNNNEIIPENTNHTIHVS